MAGKKFKFRTDANRRPGIKEVINRGMSVRGQRVSISVGLDKDFNLSRKHIIADNIFVPIFITFSFIFVQTIFQISKSTPKMGIKITPI